MGDFLKVEKKVTRIIESIRKSSQKKSEKSEKW